MNSLQKIDNGLTRVSRWFAYAGAFFILAMTCLISLDVVLRYVFNAPMLGAHEIVEYMLLSSFFLFITDCWNSNSHVRMSIVYQKLTKLKKPADTVIGIVSAILFGCLAWKLWEELLYAFDAYQVSSELRMPVWPFKLVALLGLILFVAKLLMSTVIPPKPKKH